MISLLDGVVFEKAADSVILMVGGVGFHVAVPVSTLEKIPDKGDQVQLFTYLQVREDLLQLYGFHSRDERKTFEKLISVNGVGPKVALAIISSIRISNLVQAIEGGQHAVLNKVSGVGKKTAERIVLELKGKLTEIGLESMAAEAGESAGVSIPAGDPRAEEAVAALVALGYSRQRAQQAIANALEQEGAMTANTSQLVRFALSRMG